MRFVELPTFTSQITGLVSDETYLQFQKELMLDPRKGKVIPNSGGLRKIRMRLPGRGKRGSARIVYLNLEEQAAIVFFYVYTKAKSEDLTADQLKRLRAAVVTIKNEFRL